MIACISGFAALSARSVSSPFMPGIITSSSTMSGGSPCFTEASSSSPREYENCGGAPVTGDQPAVADDGRWSGLFTKNCPENRVEGGFEPRRVPGHGGAVRWSAQLQMHVAILALLHEVGHILRQ